MIIGCDEAGRGPVLGSMFITSIKGNKKMIPNEVEDSKDLTNRKIINVYDKIKESDLRYNTIEIKTDEIDNNNITNICKKKYLKSIKKISEFNDTVYIDSFSNNKDDILNFMQSSLNVDKINVEFSADQNYKIVGAASIISKAKRESHVDRLSKKYENNIGSGYPSDPTTRKFLENYIRENHQPPVCARKSWSTITDIMNKYEN